MTCTEASGGHADATGRDGGAHGAGPRVNFQWWYWRPVAAKLCTLQDARETYTLDDLADAHEFLSMREEMERKQMAEHQKGRR